MLLANYFLKLYSKQEGKNFQKFSPEVQSFLLNHSWPGNVRELINTIRAIIAMNSGDLVDISMLPYKIHPKAPNKILDTSSLLSFNGSEITPLAELERLEIIRALNFYKKNVVKASQALGVHPSTLHRKLKIMNLEWQ